MKNATKTQIALAIIGGLLFTAFSVLISGLFTSKLLELINLLNK